MTLVALSTDGEFLDYMFSVSHIILSFVFFFDGSVFTQRWGFDMRALNTW